MRPTYPPGLIDQQARAKSPELDPARGVRICRPRAKRVLDVVPAGIRHFGQPPGGSRGARTQSVTPTRRISLASPDSLVHPFRAGFRQKGLDNMKQISTGAGLLGLGVCMVATAFIVTQRGGSQAFAQGTSGDRRIVYTNLLLNQQNLLLAYRI